MEANRFAPPGAVVDDVADLDGAVQPIRLWPPSGRLGRLRLLAYTVGLYVVFVIISAVLGGIAGATRTNPLIAIGIATVVYFIAGGVLIVQRSHDMNFSGWWGLAAIIPLVGLIWVFVPGTPGANRWGAPPPPNTLVVKIVALIFPLIAVIGILAAVALPAYQQYTVRAHAAAGR